MDLFNRLMVYDETIKKYIQDFLHVQQQYAHMNISPTAEAAKYWQENDSKNVFMSGSAVEVGNICRTLRSNRIEIEFDAMIIRGEMKSEDQEEFLIPIEDKPGFFWLRKDTLNRRGYITDFVCNVYLNTENYIENVGHAANFRRRIDAFLLRPHSDDDIVNTSQMIMKAGEGRKFERAGPSSALTYNYIEQFTKYNYSPRIIEKAYEVLGEWSCDTVPCIKLPFLPKCCTLWDVNARNLPVGLSEQLMENIRNIGCHLVGKDVEGYTNTFRASFSAAERYIFDSMPKIARRVYLAAKTIFYMHVKEKKNYDTCLDQSDSETEFKTFPSYCIKTAMLFYYTEKEPSFWDEIVNDQAFEKCLSEIYQLLLDKLEAKQLMNFFVTGVNLLDGLEIQELHYIKAKELVRAIRCKPSDYYPQNMGIIEQIFESHEILADVRIGRLNLLLKYQDNANDPNFIAEHKDMVDIADMKLYSLEYKYLMTS